MYVSQGTYLERCGFQPRTAPDKMVLNARHIIMIEPVTDGSTVAQLIAKASGK